MPQLYTGKWAIPDESQRIDLAVTNKIALAYGVEPDGSEKKAMLLQLLQNFHGYLMKYLVMIVRGTCLTSLRLLKEAKEFLRMLAPKPATTTIRPRLPDAALGFQAAYNRRNLRYAGLLLHTCGPKV